MIPKSRATQTKDDPRRLQKAARLEERIAPDEVIIQLSQRIWRAEHQITDARAGVNRLERELDLVRSSTSWRVTAPLRFGVARFKGVASVVRRGCRVLWWTATLQLSKQLRRRREAIEEAAREQREAASHTYESWVRRYDTLDESDLAGMLSMERELSAHPLVSVLMPVFDPPEDALRHAIESVFAQVYENWELCIADDASTVEHVPKVLDEYAQLDERVRVVRRDTNGGISAASNCSLEMARGELFALLDHDDMLRPHSLLLAVREFDNTPGLGLVYSDADTVDEAGLRRWHYFKPDWNPTPLLAQNYVCHLTVIRADLVRDVGGFRSEYDGSQDWDLALRVHERLGPDGVAHVPHVLYHWRALPGSVAADLAAKPYAIDAARRAVQDHLTRTGRAACVLPLRSHQAVRFLVQRPRPLVSVIIPSTGRPDLLGPCLDGLLTRTDYEEIELVVATGCQEPRDQESREYLASLARVPRVRLVATGDEAFNFSAAVNRAVAQTNSSLVLLLNDDTRPVYDDWLEILVGYVKQERVGAAGCLLIHSDGTIYSAGMMLGARGLAEHYYHRRRADVFGYSNRAKLAQDVSAVTATAMLVRREAFDDVGGFDETFPVAYNDIDFCLRLGQNGWRTTYVPDAVLVHLGSASFGTHQRGRVTEHAMDLERMRERWGETLLNDPMHNPNLALDSSHPDRLAFPPRVSYPWRDQVSGTSS